jgi:hypothetical protein
LATEVEYVRAQISTFLDELWDFGAHGILINAAKHIPKEDIVSVLRRLEIL